MIRTRQGRKRKLTSIGRKVRLSEFEILREINVVNGVLPTPGKADVQVVILEDHVSFHF